jgi:hypothetical protein
MSTCQVPLECIRPHERRDTFGTLPLVNTAAQPLLGRLSAFHDLGRASLPTATRSRFTTPPSDSSSALSTLTGESASNAPKEVCQAGGTRKRRDRLHRNKKPGAKGERIEHRQQQREEHEQRRQPQEQPDTRTVSKTQPLLSLRSALRGKPLQQVNRQQQAGGASAGGSCEKAHNAHNAEPYQEQESAHPATSAALDPRRCSSTENNANLAPSFPSPVGLVCNRSGNPLVTRPNVPEHGLQERIGSASSLAAVELAQAQGGHQKSGKTPAGEGVAIALFSFSPRQQLGGRAS